MKVYQLLWLLLRLSLSGRFRDDVCLSVLLEAPQRELGLTGVITDVDLLCREEGFIVIGAKSEDPEPWAEWPSVEDLIEASSLGTPEAKALRGSVTDEQVDRIMRRVHEIDVHEIDVKRRPQT